MNKHTPGPWELNDNFFNGITVIEQDDHQIIARVVPLYHKYRTVEEAEPELEANAHLIAASPTMYDYIKRRADDGDAEAQRIVEAIDAAQ
jgi:hypothetical protein